MSLQAKATAANMIGSRALSKKELTRRLIQKGNDASDAQAAADWLEDIGAVGPTTARAVTRLRLVAAYPALVRFPLFVPAHEAVHHVPGGLSLVQHPVGALADGHFHPSCCGSACARGWSWTRRRRRR